MKRLLHITMFSSPIGRKLLRGLITSGLLLLSLLSISQATAQTNLALNKPIFASSTQVGLEVTAANDGNLGTRWGSDWEDPQWIYVDLGQPSTISEVEVVWEGAYGSDYDIQFSNDGSNWATVASVTNGTGGTERTAAGGSAQYVRLHLLARGTGWGYSLFELGVYGSSEPEQPTDDIDLAEGKPTYSSLIEGGNTASAATDGNESTRWGSDFVDDAWIYVDLEQVSVISSIELSWEAAYGKEYKIQTSNDANNWTDIYYTDSGDGGSDIIAVNTSAQFVRMQGISRGTGWGYSLWSFRVIGHVGDNSSTIVNVPIVGPYVEFINLGLSPATNDGVDEIRVQNIVVDESVAYLEGTTVTFTKDFVSLGPNNDLEISAIDKSGNQLNHFPLTVTVYDGLQIQVEVVEKSSNNDDDLALGKQVYASTEVGGNYAQAVTDGDDETRWESEAADPQWIYIDLDTAQTFQRVVLNWEVAYGANYTIQISNDASNWQDVEIILGGNGEEDNINFANPVTARYVRMLGSARGTGYGFSLWSFEVYENTGNSDSEFEIIPDPYTAPAKRPEVGAFRVQSPKDRIVITNTRNPVLRWDAFAGAGEYDVYLNITRNDYDFTQAGNFLDRYTKIGTTSDTQFTAPDLSDRWTYKWFVVAVGGAQTQSDIGTFSVYLPEMENVDDGVNIINGFRDANKNGSIEPFEDYTNTIDVRVNDLLGRMSREDKAMQMFFDGKVYHNAGFHFGPITPGEDYQMQLDHARANENGIPPITTADTIHGYETTYPAQSGLAATKNYDLIYQLADMQRREQLAVGARGTLSPLAEVGTKVLYPRIQEGGGEDADVAAAMVRAMLVGLQAGPELNPQSISVTTKHWPSQGAGGEQQMVYDGTTVHYHMRPWHAAIEANTSGIMPGYGGTRLFGPDDHGAGDNPYIIGYLRNAMGFEEGLIMTDWLPSGSWVGSALAGADVMGGAAPAVKGNFTMEVPEDRIDDSVRKVLDMKFRMGLFENPYADAEYGSGEWFSSRNYALAVQAARESITLLKNNNTLPINTARINNIVVDGPFADIGNQFGIWKSGFHYASGALTAYKGIKKRGEELGVNVYLNDAPTRPDVAVVVVGEESYTHGTAWPNEQPYLPQAQLDVIRKYRNQDIPVVVVYVLARPSVLTESLDSASALMLTYRAGDGAGQAIADVIFGDYVPTGTLPWQLPRSMAQIGSDDKNDQQEHWDLPFDLGATAAEREEIRNKIANGEKILPIYGDPLFQFGFGLQNYGLNDGSAPANFGLVAPGNNTFHSPNLPSFRWNASSDNETGIRHYEIYVDDEHVATTKNTEWDHRNLVLMNGGHTWYVEAVNWAGGKTRSPTFGFDLNDTSAPPAFNVYTAASENDSNYKIYWSFAADAGSGIASYEVLANGGFVSEQAPTVLSDVAVAANGNRALGASTIVSTSSASIVDAATDGDPATRWQSKYSDAQHIIVDLGETYLVNRVVLNWESAYGRAYRLHASTDGENWQEIYYTNSGDGGIDSINNLSAVARYVKMEGIERASAYGYSLWEFEVYGDVLQSYRGESMPFGSNTWTIRAVNGTGLVREASVNR